MGFIFFALGASLVAGAYFNWDWFMKMWGHIDVVELFGRGCARILDIIVGLSFVVLGILMMVGIAKP